MTKKILDQPLIISNIVQMRKGTKLDNLTITDDKIILSYSRDIPEQKPTNFIGIDKNLNNVTTCDSKGRTIRSVTSSEDHFII